MKNHKPFYHKMKINGKPAFASADAEIVEAAKLFCAMKEADDKKEKSCRSVTIIKPSTLHVVKSYEDMFFENVLADNKETIIRYLSEGYTIDIRDFEHSFTKYGCCGNPKTWLGAIR